MAAPRGAPPLRSVLFPRSQAGDAYRRCIERFGLSARECVAVEDAASGVAAARAAGLSVIAVHAPALAATADLSFADLLALGRWTAARLDRRVMVR